MEPPPHRAGIEFGRFAQTSQWMTLKFGSYENYQEFAMQLVYLLAAARKKYEEDQAALAAKEGE